MDETTVGRGGKMKEERVMEKEGTFNWKGKSGKSYSFNIWPIDAPFRQIGCVYIYTEKLDNGSWEHIYVGQTEHLAKRLKEHEDGDEKSDTCIQNSGATHIHVRQVKPETDRIDVEDDIRKNYSWSCNMQKTKKKKHDED
jgi:predicted GIY-YIG superfamily endonuclease